MALQIPSVMAERFVETDVRRDRLVLFVERIILLRVNEATVPRDGFVTRPSYRPLDQKVNISRISIRRLPAPDEDEEGPPKELPSVLDSPKSGEFRLPTGVPKFS